MSVLARRLLIVMVAALTVGTVAFIVQPPVLVALWPFAETTPLTFIFVASILAAGAASISWCVIADEPAGLVGVAIDAIAIFGSLTIFTLVAGVTRGDERLALAAVPAGVAVIIGVALFMWSRRFPIRDTRPVPRLALGSIALFMLALLIAGPLLIAGTPNFLPWSVTRDLSAMVGLFFIGAASYFAYGVIRPSMGNALGQLAGFLAYDLVLIVPFLVRLPTISDELRPNLIVYIAVVTYSGLVAVAFLFPRSRATA